MRKTLKEKLKKKGLIGNLPRSFDVIGNIALIQIPEELKGKEKIIAETLLEQKNIKAVYMKGKISGGFRIPKLKLIGGENIAETIHKEYGCLFKVNVKNCFFSPRLATDRIEIARQVRPGEKVLVMFAGVAPYGIIIAKHARPKKVVCVEINKNACKYAKENIKLNKVENVEIICEDVKKVNKKIKEKFDRIVMPRPQIEYDFLREALLFAKKGTIIHFHDFIEEKDICRVKEKLEKRLKKEGKKIKILKIKKVREIGPHKLNIRIDFKID